MSVAAIRAQPLPAIIGLSAVGLAVGFAASIGALQAVSAVCVVLAGAYLVWTAPPSWSLTAGVLLFCLSGNWDQLGIPGVIAPDRLVLVLGILAILLRAPGARDRPPLRIRPVHWLMVVAVAYAAVSALASDTLFDIPALAQLVERFGIVPFLIFLCAPLAFREERDRRVLLVGLIGLGAYLSLTALFETIGADPLVFPKYILDPSYGILPDRARGPFVDPVSMGTALFACGGACLVGMTVWTSRRARLVLGGITLLCALGILFTLTRAVWAGAVLGVVAAAVAEPALRGKLAIGAAFVAVVLVGALTVVPGLSEQVTERGATQRSLWDRQILNAGAINAIEAHPLVGVGWERWRTTNATYLQQLDDVPFTRVTDLPVHNIFLKYGSEIGLVGVLLWTGVLLLGAGATLIRRPPPHLARWRALGLALLVFVLFSVNFAAGQAFPNLLIWLLAGVVASSTR